jgi:hypothetical protein
MHGHRALRRANPVAPSVQPPTKDGFLGCMCAWLCSKGAGLASIPNHVPLSLAFYMRWKDSRIFKVLGITLETSSMFMTIF